MAKPSKLGDLTRTVTRNVIQHPADLTRHYADRYGISRAAAAKYILQLEKQGWIARSGPLRGPIIALDSTRTTTEIYDQYTNAPEDFDFSKTVMPMELARFGDEQLVSRSQAKRLISQFERFKTVFLDFSDINEIGQAFADELFRVYGNAHPSVELLPTNMTDQVEKMWLRAVGPKI